MGISKLSARTIVRGTLALVVAASGLAFTGPAAAELIGFIKGGELYATSPNPWNPIHLKAAPRGLVDVAYGGGFPYLSRPGAGSRTGDAFCDVYQLTSFPPTKFGPFVRYEGMQRRFRAHVDLCGITGDPRGGFAFGVGGEAWRVVWGDSLPPAKSLRLYARGREPAFHPTKRTMAVVRGAGTIAVGTPGDLASFHVVARASGSRTYSSPSLAGGGRIAAVASPRGSGSDELVVGRLGATLQTVLATPAGRGILDIAWLGNRKTILLLVFNTATGKSDLWAFSVDSREAVTLAANVTAFAVSVGKPSR